MKNTKKMKGAGKTKSTAVAAVIFGSLFALGGTTFATPAAANAGPEYSVSAETEKQLQQATAKELHEQFMALPEVQEALAAQNDDQIKAYNQAAAGSASIFASSFMSGLVQGAGREAFDQALRALGYDPGNADQVSQALTEIQQSLNDLERQNMQIIEAIEKVNAEVRHAKFANANDRVVAASNRISDELDVLQRWVANDVTPDQSTVTMAVTTLAAQITDLRGAASDPKSGAVPLLLQAYDRNVSDTEQLWEAVTEYRDQVRVSLAQGMGGMELILENWDVPNGEYVARYDTARESTLTTVDTMYGYGVQAIGPDGQTFVQQKSGTALTETRTGIPSQDQWLWETSDVTTSSMESILKGLAEDYRPGNHNGMTLEDFLESHNIATSYVYIDTWGYRTNHDYNSTKSRRDVYYTPEVALAQIVNNKYETRKVHFGSRVNAGNQSCRQAWPWSSCQWTWMNDYRSSAERKMATETNKWRSASLGSGEYADRWKNESNRHNDAQSRVTISKNGHNGIGGWLTDSRPESIEEAGYGPTE